MEGHKTNKQIFISVGIAGMMVLGGAIITVDSVSADAVDKVTVRVPTFCTMSGTGMNTHNASIQNGTYNSNIGETALKAFCNDSDGFAIYAIGYTGDEEGKNVLSSATLDSADDIVTGTAKSGDASNWAMKLSAVSSPTPTYPITIQNSFDDFQSVPNDYTLVAKRLDGTDIGQNAEGSMLKTTYQVYVAPTQPAGTYSGRVKYVLVHPNDIPTPKSTMLDSGRVVSAKMKTLAAGTETAYNAKTSDIKAIRMADALPSDFVPSEANTVSTATSKHPIYIFFDDTNDAGIMYFYTGGYQVVMNPDSSSLFRSNLALADISGLETWDSSNVITMQAIFVDSVIELTNLDALARWDMSNVESLYGSFALNSSLVTAGYRSALSDISALANWDTSNVVNMKQTFCNLSSLSDISVLAFWDTSKVTDMSFMFDGSGIGDVSALSNWDVSKVETMKMTFGVGGDEYGAGIRSRLSDISGLANWDTKSVQSMQGMFQNTTEITNLDALSNWDVSSVEDMYFMFGLRAGESKIGNPIIDLTPLANWKVSNVTDMHCMFQNNNIASFLPLRNWNVGKVRDFNNMFNQTKKSTTTTLAGLENWDVSSATNMSSMFADSVSLTDASAINGWNIRNVVLGTGAESVDEGFNHMFVGAPVHPTFTLRLGTWNSNGTFIPSE